MSLLEVRAWKAPSSAVLWCRCYTCSPKIQSTVLQMPVTAWVPIATSLPVTWVTGVWSARGGVSSFGYLRLKLFKAVTALHRSLSAGLNQSPFSLPLPRNIVLANNPYAFPCLYEIEVKERHSLPVLFFFGVTHVTFPKLSMILWFYFKS